LISSARGVLSALIDAETGQRGYIVTGDEAFLAPYLAVRDRIGGQFKKLRQLSTSDEAHKHLDALSPLIDAELAVLAQVVELRRAGQVPGATARIAGGEGKRLMDAIRTEMNSFIQAQEGVMAEHEAEFQANMRRLLTIIVAACALTLALACSVSRLPIAAKNSIRSIFRRKRGRTRRRRGRTKPMPGRTRRRRGRTKPMPGRRRPSRGMSRRRARPSSATGGCLKPRRTGS
jgi:CHASE3 domain sensor protein